MNALTQYIDLYKTHSATINANAPEVLNRHRAAALAVLERLPGMPERGDEGYEKISLNNMFTPDYGVNISRLKFEADASSMSGCDIPTVGFLTTLVVNDSFEAGTDLHRALPDGVELISLARAAEIYPEEFEKPCILSDNPIVALNTLLVQDGVFLRVRKGVKLDKPVQILSLFNTSQALMAARRIRIVVEDGAQASILICDHPRVAALTTCHVV